MSDKAPVPIVHILIVGVTQSGKTTLAHEIANEESAKKKDKREIIVYDPVGTPTAAGTWPNGTIYFEDDVEFLEHLEKREGVRPTILFIDEADDIMAQRYPWNTSIIRRARHSGMQVVLISQRPHLIAPSARTQCGMCFMFRLGKSDAKALGEEFGHNGLHEVGLDQGDFLLLHSGTARIERANVFQLKKGVLSWAGNIGSESQRSPSSSSQSRIVSPPSRGS